MAETEENGGGDDGGGGESIGEWRGSLFSGFAFSAFPQILNDPDDGGGDRGGDAFDGGVGLEAIMECSSISNPPFGRNGGGGGGGGGGGSIAQRRAAAKGNGEFHAPRLNTARFHATSPPSVRSPYLTIPPGLSPTSLLDSPVLLSNSQALPSPTTGTFSLPSQCLDATPISACSDADKDKDGNIDSSFIFKAYPTSLHCVSGTENQVSSASEQIQTMEMTDGPMQTQVNFEAQAALPMKTYPDTSATTVEGATDMIVASNCAPLQTYDPSEHNRQSEERVQDTRPQQLQEGEKKGGTFQYPPAAAGRPSEDGYNWRKYGQKQVKGSEYPRSYYKCTHQNCQVKKKIERSHDGQITEIIYKGGHNHPQPQPSRRSAVGSPYSTSELETGEDSGSYVKVDGGSAWRGVLQGSADNKVNLDWRTDGQERTSSASVVTDASDPLSTAQGKQLSIIESVDTPELSSTVASHDEEDGATQGSISLGDDADGDESESKRRKKDTCLMETSMASRAVREPRVVVQTDSEVDILDDGYRWRKYGQKVVKGNPNPRSYYKCTSAGCSVRKHVERASHDLKYVITTYEGKHNHEVPAARSTSHMNTSGGSVPPANSSVQTSLTLPRNTNTSKPETQVQDLVPRFGRKPDFGNEYFRAMNIGGYSGEMKFVPPSCYDAKFPPYQASLAYGSFGLNATHNRSHPMSHTSQAVPSFPISVPMNVPLPSNPAMSGFGCNNLGKAVVPQSFLVNQQQVKDGDMRFLRPKQEQKDDAVFESQLPVNHLPNAPATSMASVYQQMIGGYRL